MHDNENLSEAIEQLRLSEKAETHKEKAELLFEALDTFDEHLKDFPDSPDAKRIANLRRAHARLWLTFLAADGHIDLDDTLRYFFVLEGRLGPEVDRLIAENPEFAAAHKRYLASKNNDEVLRLIKAAQAKLLAKRS